MDFVDAINRSGGDATFVSLPDFRIWGNTHAAFADLNNREIERIMGNRSLQRGWTRPIFHIRNTFL